MSRSRATTFSGSTQSTRRPEHDVEVVTDAIDKKLVDAVSVHGEKRIFGLELNDVDREKQKLGLVSNDEDHAEKLLFRDSNGVDGEKRILGLELNDEDHGEKRILVRGSNGVDGKKRIFGLELNDVDREKQKLGLDEDGGVKRILDLEASPDDDPPARPNPGLLQLPSVKEEEEISIALSPDTKNPCSLELATNELYHLLPMKPIDSFRPYGDDSLTSPYRWTSFFLHPFLDDSSSSFSFSVSLLLCPFSRAT